MWLTTKQRLRLLIKHTLSQPYNIPRYLMHLPAWGRTPIDLGIPWWSYSAIHATKKIVKREHRVFEFGTGGSTIFLSRLARSVVSLEESESWSKLVKQKLFELGIKNCEIRHAKLPSVAKNDPTWHIYLSHLDQPFDVIIIDGQDTPNYGQPGIIRTECFIHSEKFIKQGGIVIVDDSWRYEHLRIQSRAKRVETLQSLGPCRIGVTSTDIYYY